MTRPLSNDQAPAESRPDPEQSQLTTEDAETFWAEGSDAVSIQAGTLDVQDGHQGEADLRVTADSETWLGFLAKERSLLWALLRRRIRIKGSPRLLIAFGKCFPS